MNHAPMAHLLVVRFSSFGDILQCLGTVNAYKNTFAAQAPKVDWLCRSDFASLLQSQSQIDHVISFARKQGILGLIQLAWQLSKMPYTHLYDAHNNVRSNLFCLFFLFFRMGKIQFIQRSKKRWQRFLFFKFRCKVLPQPYIGQISFLKPLEKWGIKMSKEQKEYSSSAASLKLYKEWLDQYSLQPKQYIAIVASAAWPLKRWPIEYWQEIICHYKWPLPLVFLGGSSDQFISQMLSENKINSKQNVIYDLVGKSNLELSSSICENASLVISNDTGLLHIADLSLSPCIALIGPSAFGYPKAKSSHTLETQLPCKPCSKDGSNVCTNSIQQKCMKDISVNEVYNKAMQILNESKI